jgi:hypothetical protein
VTTAKVRTILGDDPHTVEEDRDAPLVEGLHSATLGVVAVEVAGLGVVLFVAADDRGPDRAMFTQGPGTERHIDVVRTEAGVECTVLKNGVGQRRMVVVLDLDSPESPT